LSDNALQRDGWRGSRWRKPAWAAAGLLLLAPLLAMQFTDEVDWGVADFVMFGLLLISAGAALELVAKKAGSSAYRIAAGIAIVSSFLLVWANGAVGIIGDEGNNANLMYYGLVVIGVVGALIVRFEPRPMARLLTAMATIQVVGFVVALVAGWGSTLPFAVVFAAMWAISARLFSLAASQGAQPVQG
jgi:hypothetical protein